MQLRQLQGQAAGSLEDAGDGKTIKDLEGCMGSHPTQCICMYMLAVSSSMFNCCVVLHCPATCFVPSSYHGSSHPRQAVFL
jgi:hypothetical protein